MLPSLLLAAAPARASDLDRVVVTATRTPNEPDRTLADVSVIDAQAIRDAGASTLPELLRTAAGIEISQNGGAGSVSGLFVRGTRTAQTLVLVDGVRLENPTSGGANLEFLPLSAIERIEIVRGPASSLYGSGAIGGVVQIFTRGGQGAARPSASVAVGSRGTAQAQAALAGQAGETRYALSFSHDRTGGFDATYPGSPWYQQDRDGNRQNSLTASLSHRIAPGWELGGNALVTDGSNRYDDAYSTPEQAVFSYRTSALSAYARGRVAEGWESLLRVGNSSIDYSYAAFAYAPRTDSTTATWQNTIAAGPGRMLLGLEWLRQRIDGEGLTRGGYVYARDDRDTGSAFAGYEIERGAHQWRASVRHDRIDGAGSENTGTLAWGWRPVEGWLARASYGTAFRAPTFDDLYNPFTGNPALLPEKSRGAEVALERKGSAGFARATVFASRIEEAIELDANYIAQNLAVARVRGLTLEGSVALGSLTLGANFTVQDPEGESPDAATGVPVDSLLARRARQYGTASALWRSGPWRVGAEVIGQGRRIDSNGAWMAGYAVVNAWLSRSIARDWEAFGRLSNVADREYETAYGFASLPRTLLVGVRWMPR